tara:strand:- start:27 stop:629 length:603 start_codon:yes stop_codon:yes gene_type:complete
VVKRIDYYFTISSPWAYLGHSRLKSIAASNQIDICYRPVNIIEIFSKTGGILLKKRSEERQHYRLVELTRWSKHLNIKINLHPQHLHASDHLANKVIIALTEMNIDPGPISETFARAIWLEDQDISDIGVISSLLLNHEIDPKPLLINAQSKTIEDKFSKETQLAIAGGIFGVPSYVAKEQIFWGQDRLDLLRSFISNNN